jgi:ubiquinone/menaquinone biosynthesis C-methylase UbiE
MHHNQLILLGIFTMVASFRLFSLAVSAVMCRAFVVPSSLRPRQSQLNTATTDNPTAIVWASSLDDSAASSHTNDSSFRPGHAENVKFVCDPSVAFWNTFDSQGNAGNLQRIQQIITAHLGTSQEARAYWLSHVLRTSYFFGNAVVGLVGHDLHQNFIVNRNEPSSRFIASILESDVGSRLLLEAMLCYEQDWKQVKVGRIHFPWDAAIHSEKDRIKIQLNHKQMNPLFALQETGRLVRETIGIYGRQMRLKGKPAGVWLNGSTSKSSTIHYPEYYLNDFHYQTDGWMSTESAERYEVSTETLFLGRQDTMQRQTLFPLKKHFTTKSPANLLEVACGTGRLATFVRDNFPKTNMTLVDLSPFYLEKARQNDAYWREYKNLDVPAANLVQANAEDLPFEDESFEAVTCVYLFHELPEEARGRAASEMARVVKPGGMVVLTDSVQLGDRPPLDKNIGAFSNLNEPHYENYISTDLTVLFEKHGLTCHEKYMASSTKTLSFIKKS